MQVMESVYDCSVSMTKLEKKIHTLTHKPLFLVALFASTSMTVLGNVVISPSLPALSEHFAHIPHADVLVPLILTIPSLFVVFFSLIAGIAIDTFGKLRFLLPSMVIWSSAGVLGFWLDNIYYILISRCVFGIATAFVIISASVLVASYYTGSERQKMLGVQGFATAGGSAVFLSIAGYLSALSWRYPFLVYFLGFVFFILAGIYLFEPKTPKHIPQEHVDDKPFRIWPFIPVYFMGFFVMATYFVSPTRLPFFITQYLHESPKIVGISMAISALSFGIIALFYERIRIYLSIKQVYLIALAAMGSAFLLFFVFHTYMVVLLGLILLGCGGGLIIVNNNSYLFSIAKPHHRGKAMGFMSSFMFLGQFASPLITQPFIRLYGLLELFLGLGITIFVLLVAVGLRKM